MDAAQHLVTLGPSAVELVDKHDGSAFAQHPYVRQNRRVICKGDPDALLLVEFAEEDQKENIRRLDQLEQLMADLGEPDSVVRAENPSFQKQIWE